MVKVEVISRLEGHIVQVTYREPFEDIFEIAVHCARFAHPRDAHRLAERVRAAIKANGWASPSRVLDKTYWAWTSSAYRTCEDCAAEAPKPVRIAATEWAMNEDRKAA